LLLLVSTNVFAQQKSYDSVKVYGIPMYSIPHNRVEEFYLMDSGDSVIFRDKESVSKLFDGIKDIAEGGASKRKLKSIRRKFSINQIDPRGYFVFYSKEGDFYIWLSPSLIKMNNELFVCDTEKFKKLVSSISSKLYSIFF